MIPVIEYPEPNSSGKVLHEKKMRSIYDVSVEEVLTNSDPDSTRYSANSVTDLLRWLDEV